MKKDFLIIFLSQFAVYFLVVINTRAYTKDNYTATAITDVVFASINFFIIKKISNSKTNELFLPYVLGGLFGSILSMYISKYLFNI